MTTYVCMYVCTYIYLSIYLFSTINNNYLCKQCILLLSSLTVRRRRLLTAFFLC